jgi:3-hydroxyisobutyrate dehydrogenase-like beta-hydroxyacid dehydrogenase
LFIFVGGREDTIWHCQPLFDAIGWRTLVISDDPAEANLLQLCAVGLVGALIESLGEAIALSDKGGIGGERFLKLMSESLFTTGLHASYGALLAEADATALLTVNQGNRNAGMLLDSAHALGVRMPLVNLLQGQLNALTRQGLGDQDWLTIFRSGVGDA